MAERRMFAKTIIDSDAFLDMPLSSQALYFHLSMRADDDGFLNNAKKIQRTLGCADDDLKILFAKNFVIPFETGVCVIKHWLIHNMIQKDRYKVTMYSEEKDKLSIKNNKSYTMLTECVQDVNIPLPQVRLGKVSLGKDSKYIPPIPAELLSEWKRFRKNKPVTERIFNEIEKQAQIAGITSERAIEICCENGWGGFKADWIKDKSNKPSFQDSRESAARTAFGSLLTDPFQNQIKEINHE